MTPSTDLHSQQKMITKPGDLKDPKYTHHLNARKTKLKSNQQHTKK
jgi:hypothetical protein